MNPIKSVTPKGNNILLELEKDQVPTHAGILLIPEAYRDKAVTAKVIAVGPGGRKGHKGQVIRIEVKPGDRVYTARYGGDDIDVDGRILKLIDYEYIFGVLAV